MLEKQAAYWREALQGAPALLELPTDRPRPAAQTYNGAYVFVGLDAERVNALRALGRAEDVTLYMVLLSAFNLLLARYARQDDIVVGTTIANRTRPELESLIGFFANTLVLRSRVKAGESFAGLLRSVKATCLGAYDHQDVPFEYLLEVLQVPRSLSHSPLFQVMFNLHNAPQAAIDLPGLKVSLPEGAGNRHTTAKFDLTLEWFEAGERLRGRLEYNTDLFDRETVEGLLANYRVLLEEIVRHPHRAVGELALLDAEGYRRVTEQWNGPQWEPPAEVCLQRLFEAQVARTPSASALIYEDRQLNYAELNARANRVAHYLIERGVGPERSVGVCLERGFEMVIGVLAVLKAGGCYIPLDPGYPAARIEQILEDSRAGWVLTEAALKASPWLAGQQCIGIDEIDQSGPADNPPVHIKGENLAYVIYTSGSTGRPKGVQISHASLVNFLLSMQSRLQLQADDRWLAVTTLSFDIAVLELYLPLISGAQCRIAPRAGVQDAEYLIEALTQGGISVLQATPSTWRLLLAGGWQGGNGLKMLCGGEAWTAELGGSLLERGGRLWNVYGPTETTVWSAAVEIEAGAERILIGEPLDNTTLYVVDDNLNVVPEGVPGELCIGGLGLARGYAHRAGLTADRFIPDPYAGSGQRLYRTGDLVRRLSDGRLEFMGRLDHQVKLRGFRIELGEIEHALAVQPGVEKAVVELHNGETLVAYVEPQSGVALEVERLREGVRARLPDYMRPSHYEVLEKLPLTPNGKLDRKALPEPGISSLPRREYVAPQSESERVLAVIWAEVLKLPVENISVHDDFFELGGHSLLAMKIVAQVRGRMSAILPLRAMFEHSVLRELAACVDRLLQVGLLEGLPSRLAPQAGSGYPVSAGQKRLWLLYEMDPHSSAYHSYNIDELPVNLEPRLVESIISELITRHESFRTVFRRHDDEVMQYIRPPFPVALGVDDVKDENGFRRILTRCVEKPFDLTKDPLLRVHIVRLPGGRQRLISCVHEIIADGYSHVILRNEMHQLLNAARSGAAISLPPLEIQYKDFAAWQNTLLQDEKNASRVYWRDRLGGGDIKRLDLPFDFPFTSESRTPAKSYETVTSPQLRENLNHLARANKLTLFAVLQAAFSAFLARLTGQSDIVVAIPVAGRDYPFTEKLVGFFLNTLLMRHRVDMNESFRSLLERVSHTIRQGLAHQSYPFEELLNDLTIARKFNRFPVTPVILNMLNFLETGTLMNPIAGAGAETREKGDTKPGVHSHVYREAKAEFELYMIEFSDAIFFSCHYRSDLFRPETIEYLLAEFIRLLEQVALAPEKSVGTYDIFDRSQQVGDAQYPGALISPYLAFRRELGRELVFESVLTAIQSHSDRQPDACAILNGTQVISYRDLWKRSDAVAHALFEIGVLPGQIVAILTEDPVSRIVAMLGGLKASTVIMPLDIYEPLPRLQRMVQTAVPAAWMVQGQGADQVQSLQDTVKTPVVVMSDNGPQIASGNITDIDDSRNDASHPKPGSVTADAGYIFFTSGSTGTPKAVHGTIEALSHFVRWEIDEFGLDSTCRVSQLTAPTFDPILRDVFAPLCTGGAVCIPPRRTFELLPSDLLAWLDSSGVNLVHCTPTVFRRLLEEPLQASMLSRLQYVLLAGEALTPADVQKWMSVFGERIELVNLYGQTETTMIRCFHRVSGQDIHRGFIPVGRPLPDTAAIILDENGSVCPREELGELYLRSPYASLGYYNRSDLTKEVFVDNPFSFPGPNKMYRTGDLAEFLPDGTLRLAGRRDSQVKVRGVRIDTAEVENVLLGHPGVQSAAVIGVKTESRVTFLQAVAACAPDADVDEVRLREYLLQHLPPAFVPGAVHIVDALPLTKTGKVDREALVAEYGNVTGVEQGYEAPRTDRERIFIRIWSRMLKIPEDRISLHDEFYALGGDSLLSLRIIDELRRRGFYLTPRQFLQYQTVAKLAAVAEREAPGVEQGVVTGELPLNASLRWFFGQENPPKRWNMRRVFEFQGNLDPDHVMRAFEQLLIHHDGLRARFVPQADGTWKGHIPEPDENIPFECVDIDDNSLEEAQKRIASIGDDRGGTLDFTRGPLCRLILFRLGPNRPAYLYMLFHHILVDGSTIDILLADLMTAYRQLAENRVVELPPKSSSIIQVNRYITDYTESINAKAEEDYWNSLPWDEMALLPADYPKGVERNISSSSRDIRDLLTLDETRRLQQRLAGYGGNVSLQNAVFTAVTRTIAEWTGNPWVEISSIEAKGDVLLNAEHLDIVRTVGWLSMPRVLVLKDQGNTAPHSRLREIARQIDLIPNHGFGPALLSQGTDDPELQALGREIDGRFKRQIEFNYRGSVSTSGAGAARIKQVVDLEGRFEEGDNNRRFVFLVIARVVDGQLEVIWQYSKNIHKKKTIQKLLDMCIQDLRSMACSKSDDESNDRSESLKHSGERLSEVTET
ncbi:MAG TPA: amino acid adenylation domain-containing protein [Gammaproteobacteria bacterium]